MYFYEEAEFWKPEKVPAFSGEVKAESQDSQEQIAMVVKQAVKSVLGSKIPENVPLVQAGLDSLGRTLRLTLCNK